MPASLPSLTIAENQASGAAGAVGSPSILMDPLSGPKGSPFSVKTLSFSGTVPTYTAADTTQTPSTGALSTGIGIGTKDIIAQAAGQTPVGNPQAIFRAGFNDNDIPGEVPTYAAGGPPPVVSSSAINSTRMYIGGGRSITNSGVNPPGQAGCNPYTAGVGLCAAGNGGSRDGGAGPAFTGFPLKMVTATAGVAVGAAVEAGWVNRAQRALVANESVFGSSTTQLAAAS